MHEQARSKRRVWLAFYKEQLAGYVTLKWLSYYEPFRQQNIPEIMDLNVLPPYVKEGINSWGSDAPCDFPMVIIHKESQ